PDAAMKLTFMDVTEQEHNPNYRWDGFPFIIVEELGGEKFDEVLLGEDALYESATSVDDDWFVLQPTKLYWDIIDQVQGSGRHPGSPLLYADGPGGVISPRLYSKEQAMMLELPWG